MSVRLEKLNLNYNEIKSLVLEYFKQKQDTQYMEICYGVGKICIQKNMVKNPNENQVVYGEQYLLNSKDNELVREILWDLIIQRILTIGLNESNPDWPFIKVTEYGKKVLESNLPIPHDPSGYLDRVKKEIPFIDNIIFKYLEESINTYNIGAYLSSSITLGCASEKALLILIESYTNSIKNISKKESFEKKVKERFIKRQYEEFSKALTSIIGNLPTELSDNLTTILLGIFEMIRNNRNDAGHPTGKIIAKDQIFAYLQVFIEYCKKIYNLKEYFDNLK